MRRVRADHIRAAAEAILPAALAYDNDAIVSRETFAREEISAELRLDAQGCEKIGRRPHGAHHLGGLARFGETGIA